MFANIAVITFMEFSKKLVRSVEKRKIIDYIKTRVFARVFSLFFAKIRVFSTFVELSIENSAKCLDKLPLCPLR